jgi:hypothetical protein
VNAKLEQGKFLLSLRTYSELTINQVDDPDGVLPAELDRAGLLANQTTIPASRHGGRMQSVDSNVIASQGQWASEANSLVDREAMRLPDLYSGL